MKKILFGLLLSGCFQPVASLSSVDAGAEQNHSSPGFCADYAEAYCDHTIRCGRTSASGRAECVTLSQGSCAGEASSAALGYRIVDGAKATVCLDHLATGACDQTGCEGVFTAAVDTGGDCLVPADCRNPSDSCVGAPCLKTCQRAGARGQSCRQDLSCDVGLLCDWPTKECVPPSPPGGVGADCGSLTSYECDGTAYCSNGLKCAALRVDGQACSDAYSEGCTASSYCNANTCRPRRAVGAPCSAADLCQRGLWCETTCKPRSGLGAVCSNAVQCTEGLRCTLGACSSPKAPGLTCSSTDECADGLGCDRVSQTCEARVYGLKQGDSCTGDQRTCSRHLACTQLVATRCGPTIGFCAPLAIGDPCKAGWLEECPVGVFCQPTAGSSTGTCALLSDRAVCSSTQACKPTQICSLNGDGGFSCTGSKQAGESCSASGQCESPLSCVPQKAGGPQCRRLGELGDTCSYNKSLEASCLFPFHCSGGTCQRAGAKGESCLNGSQCLWGSCDAETFLCGPKLLEGAACGSSNSACASGFCSNGTCTAVCGG